MRSGDQQVAKQVGRLADFVGISSPRRISVSLQQRLIAKNMCDLVKGDLQVKPMTVVEGTQSNGRKEGRGKKVNSS
jgi:hypothetical protein